MGRIKEIILEELKGLTSLSVDSFEDLANAVEIRLLKERMPKISIGKDPWLAYIDSGIKIKVQGANKEYILVGDELKFFIQLYAAYGYKRGKVDAAGAFVSTIIFGDFKSINGDEKNELAVAILRAAKKECDQRDPERGTPKMLQGWITSRRYLD